MSWQPRTPPQPWWPITIRCSMPSAITAYSTAAEVPCERPSGSLGGTRLAMLRWMKKSPGCSSPKISEISTRLSQQVMIIAFGLCPFAASARAATSSGVRRACQAR